jgi:hypothetical protein
MMGWQPIETAPKGKTRIVRVGDKGGEREIHMPEYLLVPTGDGGFTLTSWLPGPERWNMFTKAKPPTKWWDFGDGKTMPDPPA